MENVTKKIENDNITWFSYESWLGGEVVKEHFSRLFNLAMEKSVSVMYMVLGIGVEVI